MALDKLVDSTQLDSDLTSVANAIRTKGGTSAQLAFPADFVSAINAISGGGGEVTFRLGNYNYRMIAGTFTTTTQAKSFTISTGLTGGALLFSAGYMTNAVADLTWPTDTSLIKQVIGWGRYYPQTMAQSTGTLNAQAFTYQKSGSYSYYQGGTTVELNTSTGKLTIGNSKTDCIIMPSIQFYWVVIAKGAAV